jgi:hypothetical protein
LRKAASASGGASADMIIMAGSPDIRKMKKENVSTKNMVTNARRRREAM